MSRFDECLAVILKAEGGYSNDAADRGGATNYGVTQETYDGYRRAQMLPAQPVKFITREEADDIYLTEYWRPAGCDFCGTPLDLVVFDAAVQHGVHRAIKFMQSAIGAAPDGDIGPYTKHFLAQCSPLAAAVNLIDIRRDFYKLIVEHDASQERFARGWANRMDALLSICQSTT